MREDLSKRCDALEEAYEFMLAYAAQGLPGDTGSQTGGQLRQLLTKAATSLAGIGDVVNDIARREGLQPADRYQAFAAILQQDADRAAAILQLVLAQPAISSQLIDNVNASIHVRTILTDLFVIDEILKPSPSAANLS